VSAVCPVVRIACQPATAFSSLPAPALRCHASRLAAPRRHTGAGQVPGWGSDGNKRHLTVAARRKACIAGRRNDSVPLRADFHTDPTIAGQPRPDCNQMPTRTLTATLKIESALWACPFRPFFLAASGYAMLAVVGWLGVLLLGWPLAGDYSPLQWHSHEMLFGMVGAAIAGFLLTAMCNWTGAQPLSGR